MLNSINKDNLDNVIQIIKYTTLSQKYKQICKNKYEINYRVFLNNNNNPQHYKKTIF